MERTGQMSKPAVFPACLTPEQTARLRRCVLDIVAEVAREHQETYGYRLWLDGRQSEDLTAHFAAHPTPDEDLETWVARAFGDKKFGIILNRGEKFSQQLSRSIAFALQPLLERIGMPSEGFLFTIFIGNYDMTPLGIHKDLPGKSVMHFHLGPGAKTIYTWEDDDYACPPEQRQNNMTPGPHLATATRHTFQEGEIYFMPENKFHLGTQDGLSIGVACWCNNRSSYDFGAQLMQWVRRKYLQPSDVMLKADKNGLDDISAVEQTIALFDFPEQSTVKDLMRDAYKDHKYAMYSNGGFRNAPLPNTAVAALGPASVVQIEEPYRFYHYLEADGGQLVLYVRGTRIALRHRPGVIALLEALNGGARLSLDAVHALLGAEWPVASVHYLLKLLHRHHGIRVS
ncbi:MAG: hypothetical protein V4578_26705 [Pseudomonadota bacterium]